MILVNQGVEIATGCTLLKPKLQMWSQFSHRFGQLIRASAVRLNSTSNSGSSDYLILSHFLPNVRQQQLNHGWSTMGVSFLDYTRQIERILGLFGRFHTTDYTPLLKT